LLSTLEPRHIGFDSDHHGCDQRTRLTFSKQLNRGQASRRSDTNTHRRHASKANSLSKERMERGTMYSNDIPRQRTFLRGSAGDFLERQNRPICHNFTSVRFRRGEGKQRIPQR
jgi:hypothetical protein